MKVYQSKLLHAKGKAHMFGVPYAGDRGIAPGVAPDYLRAPGYTGSHLSGSFAQEANQPVDELIQQLGLTSLGDARYPSMGTFKEVPVSFDSLVTTLSSSKQQSQVLSRTVLEDVKEELATVVGPSGLFPFREMDPRQAPVVILEQLIYDSEVARQLPEMAVPFVPAHRRATEAVHLNRVGMGLEILATALNTPEGMQTWANQLRQVSSSVERYIYLSVFAEMLHTASDPETSGEQKESMALFRDTDTVRWRDRVQRELERFNILMEPDGGGAIKLQQHAINTFTNRGEPVRRVILMVPMGTKTAFTRLSKGQFSYMEAGPLGPDVRYGKKEAMEVGIRDVELRESRTISVAKNRTIDPLERQLSVGEVFAFETCHLSGHHIQNKVRIANEKLEILSRAVNALNGPLVADPNVARLQGIGQEVLLVLPSLMSQQPSAAMEHQERCIEVMDFERNVPTVISIRDAIKYAGFSQIDQQSLGGLRRSLYEDFLDGGYTDTAIALLFSYAIASLTQEGATNVMNALTPFDAGFMTENPANQTMGMKAVAYTQQGLQLEDILLKIYDTGIPLPLKFVIYRPHMRLSMGSAVAVIPGEQTGEVVWSRPNFIVGADAHSTLVFGNFSVFTRCVIKDSKRLIVYSTARVIRFGEGCGCSFWDPNSPTDHDAYLEFARGTHVAKSMFSFYTSFESWSSCVRSLSPCDFSGALDARFQGNTGARTAFHEYYVAMWSIASTEEQYSDGQMASCPSPHNTVCFLGPHLLRDENRQTRFVNGEGHFGDYVPAKKVADLVTGNTSSDLIRFPTFSVYTRPEVTSGRV